MYADAQGAQGEAGGAQAGAEGAGEAKADGDEDVVDAEIVDDEQKPKDGAA